MKKYQKGGAVRAAKRMSKALKPVKKGVTKTKAEPARTIDTGKYIKNKNIKKGMSTKPLTSKYSKVMKNIKAVPSKKVDLYGPSSMKKAVNKAKSRKPLSSSLSKKVKTNFGAAEWSTKGYPYNFEKRRLPKPKMMKGGSLRRSIKHK